jgi:carbonic anhydrase
MPVTRLMLRRTAVAAAWLVMGWVGATRASDHAAPAPKAATSASAAASDADAPAKVAKPAKAEPREIPDPMEMLREKLAKKLGASKVANPDSPNVLRVVTNPSASAPAAEEHGAAATPPRPARRKAPLVEAPHAAADHVAHWDYTGAGGPESWGQMKPEFAKCSTGTRQSPIDIRDGIKVNLDAVQFDYKASGFRVIDNGHTVQVNVGPGNSIEVMGKRYDLVQFHFHRPSEERINGRQFDMVVHLVHKDLDGRLAVVAVLLERGSAQPIVQSVWNNLPLEKGDEVAARTTINLNDLLPADRNYFTYMGSLTTPPCSEGVLWMVMKEPVQISGDQIGIFARLYPMNARPIQSASGRLIKESN